MDDFLKETKKFLEEAGQGDKNLHVVIGNESCDLDSVIAALTYSYFLHKTSASDSIHSLPVLTIPRSQSHLKTDSNFLLCHTGINPDHLTYRDHLDLQQKGRLSLTLVDHNVLVGSNVSLEESVTMVIDHHQLERKPSNKVKLVHDLVGSCCSLVAGILLDSPEFPLTPQIAKMLIGTILVDTVNTSPEAGKTTPYDQEMLGRLMSLILDLDTEKLFDDIQQAKNDVSALSKREILEKDQKQVTHGNQTVVMSSISTSLQTFLQGSDVKQALDSVLHDRKGQCVVVMTMQVEAGVPHREILVYSNNGRITQELADFLETDTEVQLDLQPLPCDLRYSLAYSQGNVKASRKKVLPLVKSFLEKSSVPQDDLYLS
uniref:Exopolyphosphatase PRUNE1-like n=1 Tax=Crassostrea virginica TaxID=6565 RepID=A0A8B8B218_CRAVI|nr:exopolyphosphatase PRUNE1-like [Crassostrea virginica]XP_022297350.1 exopolyphosphatase PRUNE1-like [Crassostrea virginica]XP_022297351.1 exopolyphosphatase PRUNE1-like [Crassostrea virginica]